jgi:hypothetical protein
MEHKAKVEHDAASISRLQARITRRSEARSSLHHNTEIGDGQSDAKSGYNDRRFVAKML